MNKEQMIEKIGQLPEFELVKVAVDNKDQWEMQPNHKAVVEKGKSHAVAYVTNRYHLAQMSEVFMPIALGIEDFSGQLFWYGGKGVMNINPTLPEFSDGEEKFGITCINSVDKSTSIVIKFNVMVNSMCLGFPKKMAAFSKNHSKKGFKITKDYIEMVTKVKTAWKNIINQFPNLKITADDLPAVCEIFSMSKKLRDTLEIEIKYNQKEYNAWDIVELRLDEISNKDYTSDVHKQEALNRLCNQIFNYATAAGI